MRLDDWLREATQRLANVGIDSARLEAQLIAAHVLLAERSWVLAHPEHEFNDLAGESLLQRRERREPLAYLLGYREFFGRRFRVNSAVLIPRQETEVLVETVLRFGDSTLNDRGPIRALDIGVGSGAIAVTLKLERPEWEVTGLDISPAALDVAGTNAQALGADIRFALSNGFDALPAESFDLIVTNPPYIANDEVLMREVADYEPREALFAGENGLEFYLRLAEQAGPYLAEGGRLAMEVGFRQAREVVKIFLDRGWRFVEIVPDLSEIERVVVVQPAFEERRII